MNKNFIPKNAAAALAMMFIVSFMSGCGGEKTEPWLKKDGDYVRVVEKRAMTMVWGVIINIEQCTADDGTIENSGEIGETPEESDASVHMVVGNVIVDLKTTKNKMFEFRVNDRSYGKVKAGDRVLIDEERYVEVNDKVREPQ